MLVQAACLTMPRFCHTSKNVSCTGTAAFREIKYRCGMRSGEDDSLKRGMAWRTGERKIHEHTSWCVMHTLLTQEEKVLLPLHAATHTVIHTHTHIELDKCDSERFANNMQKPEAPQPNRWEKKEPPSSEARPDAHTQTISTQETKTERRAATQAHITHYIQ